MTHDRVTVPVGRDRKIQNALRANQIAELVLVPFGKKKKASFARETYSGYGCF